MEECLPEMVPISANVKNWTVSELIANGRWEWRKLQGLVPDETLQKISGINSFCLHKQDDPVWDKVRNGFYTVKKGYMETKMKKFVVDGRAGGTFSLPNSIWGKVWKLKILPKITHFAWRCLVGAVPVKEALVRRRCCNTSVICPICNQEVETIEHTLFLCSRFQGVWFASALSWKIDCNRFQSFGLWFEKILIDDNVLNEFQLAYVAWIIWLVWKERNSVVFEAKQHDPIKVVQLAEKAVREFWKANDWMVDDDEPVTKEIGWKGWRPPDFGVLKINCDGSCSLEAAAIGLVCRDHAGGFMWGFGEVVKSNSAFLTEVLAVLKALVLSRI
ncbi:uncharacterized protein LOC114712741 [Neltuma alba]|uniref:uncharacterized protein LOC114712741 n=1 Tax=Neltuma alba TaxID=207710 RepID=UPI0010A40C09|nr:uncharacterized protein LOC114712741 [Prosopis alba]